MAVSIDDLQRRYRSAHNRRALQEVATATAEAYQLTKRQADEAEDSTGKVPDDLVTLLGALQNLLNQIDARINRNAVADDLATRSARPLDRADRGFEAGKYQFELRGMILEQLRSPLPGLDLGRSHEISAEIRATSPRAFKGIPVPIEALALRTDYYPRRIERRADTISTDLPAAGPGANLIATVLDAGRYVDALRARSVLRQAGATVLSGMVGNYDIPRMAKTSQVSWFGEGQSIARPQPEQFDRVSFSVKHCGAIIAYSIDMLLNSTPSIEMLIRDDLSKLLALDMDRVALVGSGQNSEPLGVIRRPDVTQIPATEFGYLSNVELRRQLSSKNVPLESISFFGNSQVDAWSLSALDAMSRPLGKALAYLGYPDFTSNVVTAAAVAGPPALPAVSNPLILLAASDVIVSFWRELDVQANGLVQSAWDTGGVEVRAILDADTNLRHAESAAWMDCQTGPQLPPLVGGGALSGTGAAARQAPRH